MKTNNVWVLGFKEGVEGNNLVIYLENLFADSDSELVIWILAAYKIGSPSSMQKYSRNIQVKFPSWEMKS